MAKDKNEMITLGTAAKLSGVPVRILRLYAKDKKIWAKREETPAGAYWLTTPEEAERAKRLYRPHVKKL